MPDPDAAPGYEAKVARLEEILSRLDDSQTPIDELAQDGKSFYFIGDDLAYVADCCLAEPQATTCPSTP